ncbi:MAG: Methylated-DNA--protein-cysteine methyltransferase [Burkholderiaceae bacterium]|jgi:methylated-DNA-[protein]-cysteine S-methyltransferase|nr:MAG: Methylated-DNA--protein-cysteine methyltransferase [Burkholderiaceae bacterium]
MKHDIDIRWTAFDGPLGRMIVAATTQGIAGVWFDDQRHLPDMNGWREDALDPLLKRAVNELTEYFDGRRKQFDLPLDLYAGTAFQQSVWRALLAIPRGETVSYRALSARIGRPTAQRAVGAAVGRNPIGVVVPCHRVLGADGALTGYAGGLERKVALLRIEGVAG